MFMASCSDACVETEDKIYGSISYTEDSSICKAASHMGVLGSNLKPFKVMVERG
jgi:hypothetical protein